MDYAITLASLGTFFALVLAWLAMPQSEHGSVDVAATPVVEMPAGAAISQAA